MHEIVLCIIEKNELNIPEKTISRLFKQHIRSTSVSAPYQVRIISVSSPYLLRLYRYGADTEQIRSEYGTIAMPGRQRSMNIGYFSLRQQAIKYVKVGNPLRNAQKMQEKNKHFM